MKTFSWTELLIVVAVLLIIVALAIPSLLRRRISYDEESAVRSVRAINSAEIKYAAAHPNLGFACTLTVLAGDAPPSGPDGRFIDPPMAVGINAGYAISITGCSGEPATAYRVTARPVAPGQTGVRIFCSDQTGVIRYTSSTETACNTTSVALQRY